MTNAKEGVVTRTLRNLRWKFNALDYRMFTLLDGALHRSIGILTVERKCVQSVSASILRNHAIKWTGTHSSSQISNLLVNSLIKPSLTITSAYAPFWNSHSMESRYVSATILTHCMAVKGRNPQAYLDALLGCSFCVYCHCLAWYWWIWDHPETLDLEGIIDFACLGGTGGSASAKAE